MEVRVIGGGLAGSEACYQLLKRGYNVKLYEMRKVKNTPCHTTCDLAELVCSNSLKSLEKSTASGTLKEELKSLDCLLLRCAERAKVPSGGALAVNRKEFSKYVEEELNKFENFERIDKEFTKIDVNIPTIIATGPLTSDDFANEIANLIGNTDNLHFYDAVAPIVSGDSLDYNKLFFATRYDKGEQSDYLNCGMNKEQYTAFYNELVNGKVANLHSFEKGEVFESCMPIEVMAKRGAETIRYGMMKPVGITNPNTGERYYAVVQLRKENVQGSAYNLVGFQTNLTFPEQKRIFSILPGLENMEFLRYGVIHRNTFLNSPEHLDSYFALNGVKNVYFSVIFVNEKEIQEINKEYRGIDKVTDVISFALEDNSNIVYNNIRVLGDIYICIPRMLEQASSYGHSKKRELSFLTVHGLLHLLGYDHMKKEDEEEMFALQELILNEEGITR